MPHSFHALSLLAAVLVTGCGLTAQQVAAVSLEGANAAIVSAARDLDAAEAVAEQACVAQPSCVAAVRARFNPALAAYDEYRDAWAALKDAWNRAAPQPEIDAAAAKVTAAERGFYASKAAARMVQP